MRPALPLLLLASLSAPALAMPAAPPSTCACFSHHELGVRLLAISPALRAVLGSPTDRGLLVDDVDPEGSAALAGLSVGDIIAEADGVAIRDVGDLEGWLSAFAGRQITLRVIRRKRRRSIVIELPSLPPVATRTAKKANEFEFEAEDYHDLVRPDGRVDERVKRRLETQVKDLETRLEELRERLDARERIERAGLR